MLLAGNSHIDFRGYDSASIDVCCRNLVPFKAELQEFGREIIEGNACADKRSECHITAEAADRIEISKGHDENYRCGQR